MAMLNRTADLIGRNVTPLSPALLKLEPEQRIRLLRSTQKVGKVLGTTPTLDVVSPSASTFFPPVTPSTPAKAVRRKPSFILPRSPASFIHSVTSRVPPLEDSVKSPVVRYRLADRSAQPSTASPPARNILRRAHIPAALNLPQPRRNDTSPLSPFRYNVIGGPLSARFSPLPAFSPFSPFSPITVQKIEARKLEKLEKLDRLARCADDTLPPEFIYPSLGQVGEKVEKISSYLDLYRMGAKDDTHLPRAKYEDQEYISVRAEIGDPDNCSTRSRPLSRGQSMSRRRSHSVGDFHAIGSPQSERGADGRFSRCMSSLAVQTPFSAMTRSSYQPFSPSVYSDAVSTGADDAADAAARTGVDSPRTGRTCSIASAKRSILGADAKLMAEFRTRFGTRPLEFHVPSPFPAPLGPLPSPPVSPTLEQVKSPKVPYWVKSSYRPRTSMRPLGFSAVDPHVQAKSASSSSRRNGHLAPPATPRTRRIERRQGWGGQWNSMGGVIDQLKQM